MLPLPLLAPASYFFVRTKTCPETVDRTIDPSSPTPTSVTAVNFRRSDQIRCGFGVRRGRLLAPSGEVEVEESRVNEKTSPREERAAKVLPHDVILTMLGFAET